VALAPSPARHPRPHPRRRSVRDRAVASTLLGLAILALAPTADAAIERTPFLTGLDFPTNLAFAPDGRLFFTEKNTGSVRVVSASGRLEPEPFVRFPVANDGETGMLGIALHPAFEREPWVYLYFSDAASGNNVLVRVRDDGGRAGERQMLRSFLPWSIGYHNGGDLLFGADGRLYVAVGEAHEPERAQDPGDVGGKILRLEPDGSVPRDNPFAGSPAFTVGHRNSFGLCLDRRTGDLWETENGPDVDDEVNVLRAGRNYGWPEVTGDSGGRFEDPVAIFPSPEALTGCAVWRGDLWFGAAITGVVYRMPVDRRGVAPELAEAFDAPVIDVVVGPDEGLYVATSSAIVHLAGDEPAPTRSASPTDAAGPTQEPTDAPPVVMPERGGSDDGASAAVPVVAAVILAAALWVRLRAGRALRRAAHDRNAGSDDPADPAGR
jgi:glucose/arabinose dehydrogenase